jgi:hypothetical protein
LKDPPTRVLYASSWSHCRFVCSHPEQIHFNLRDLLVPLFAHLILYSTATKKFLHDCRRYRISLLAQGTDFPVLDQKNSGNQWTAVCKLLWTSGSNKDIMDGAVSTCGLPAPTSTLWTVLSAPVDFLLQPGYYGLFCQHLWTSCSNQVTVDCAVSICGLPVPTRSLWTVLSASVDFLLQPAHYGPQHTNKQTNKTFCYCDSSRRTRLVLIRNRHCRSDCELWRNCLRQNERLFYASWNLYRKQAMSAMWYTVIIYTHLFALTHLAALLHSCSVY